jgi:hypothetical protein
LLTELQQAIIEAAENALGADEGFEKQPTYCARWVRQVLATVPGVLHPPSGLDARAQFLWFQRKGKVVPVTRGSVPGDILYQTSAGHGIHGHVMIRVLNNLVAENSSYHSHHGSDARGTRQLSRIGRVSGIVRLWGP